MSLKRLVYLLMATVMVLSLAACTASNTPAADGGGADKAADAPAKPASGDMPKLIWWMGDPGKVPPDQKVVEEALNAYTEEHLGIHVNTLYMNNDKIQQLAAAGDYFDIAFTCEWFFDYAKYATQGMFADITDKLPQVSPDLYSGMPELVWEGAKVNGKIYAVPVYKDTAAVQYWLFDKALIVDELGEDISKYNDITSIEPLLAKIKAARPDEYPIATVVKGGWAPGEADYDMIVRNLRIGLSYRDKNTTVVSAFEHDFNVGITKKVYEWQQQGYLNPDALTVETAPKYSAIKTGQGFKGAEAIWSTEGGYEIVINAYHGPVLSTASIRGAMNGIYAASNYVDEALRFMELVSTDRTYRDMLRYGIEGVNFNYTDDKASVNVLNDSYRPWGFSQGSYILLTPEFPSTVSDWDDTLAKNDQAAKEANPDTIGFSYDRSKMEAQIAACTVIVEKYVPAINCGLKNPDEELPVLLGELEKAGYRDIIADVQVQLDEYVAWKQSQ